MNAICCRKSVLGQIGISIDIPTAKSGLQLAVESLYCSVFHTVTVSGRQRFIYRVH